MAASSQPSRPWWETGVIYQVYPRSFQDSDGDGIGDLAGIEARLDYLAALGIDAVWLSPIFPSPMADFGYDVADYCDIDPVFGDLAAFDRLLAAAHRRGLKLMLDFVPNHSSDRHRWFQASRSSRDDPKRDWYIWRDAAPGGGPPNNWISDFGGSAWEWDAPTGQYYLHAFLKEQPDLNWRNPDVRDAMMDVMRFWFDRGVDGFRIDVLWHIVKAQGLPDNPPNPGWTADRTERDRVLQTHSTDQPEAHALSAEMRALADSYGARLLVGEIFLPNDRHARWYGTPERPQVHLPFNFQLIENDWDAGVLARMIADYEASLPAHGWPNWVIGSHDAPRIAARIGEAQARVAAMLLLTLRGTPTLYQGDELGIGKVDIPPDRIRDPQHLRQPLLDIGRDRSRTPMPWDASPHAGFSPAEPWLPLHSDWPTRNVAAQERDPGSMLLLYRRLLALRRAHPALAEGSLKLIDTPKGILGYQRGHDGQRLTVLLNLTSQCVPCPWAGTVLASTLAGAPEPGMLRPDEGCDPGMKIAMLAPIAWRTPPRHYGPWELVTSLLTEALVDRGIDVTLFATQDSVTAAKLDGVVPAPYSEDPSIDAKVWEFRHLAHLFERADRFDLIHNQADFPAHAFARLVDTPMVTTIHGFSSDRILPMYKPFETCVHYVAISAADRHPDLRYAATIHHGIPVEEFRFDPVGGEDLLFFGRIHPDKGAKEAIAAARAANRGLDLYGIVQDQGYYERDILPTVDGAAIRFHGTVGGEERLRVLGSARALLHLINFDEPFGLSVVEAMASGTPVIAARRGSMPELIAHGVTGFLVDTPAQAVAAIAKAADLDRAAIRRSVARRFSVDRMADEYVALYRSILGTR